MVKAEGPPDSTQVRAWIGKSGYGYWKRIVSMIERNYFGVFSPEWLYGGKKHGWSLRYKKGRSFCTLIPEKGRIGMLIVFGAKERATVDTIRNELSSHTLKEYDKATTYHDGKWLLLTVDSDAIFDDVERLLAVTRKPKIKQ